MLSAFGFWSIFFLSPIVVFLVVVILSLRYRAWEAPFMGLCVDLTWGPSGSVVALIPYATLISIFIVWALEPLRSELLTS